MSENNPRSIKLDSNTIAHMRGAAAAHATADEVEALHQQKPMDEAQRYGQYYLRLGITIAQTAAQENFTQEQVDLFTLGAMTPAPPKLFAGVTVRLDSNSPAFGDPNEEEFDEEAAREAAARALRTAAHEILDGHDQGLVFDLDEEDERGNVKKKHTNAQVGRFSVDFFG